MTGIKTKFKSLKRRVSYKAEIFASEHKIGRLVEVSVSDMFYKHVSCGELLRYDMVVRYLAIENYFGKNDYGFVLYKKMQDARVGGGEYGEKAVKQFKSLIESYECNGYDNESYILLDRNLNLIDGSHRMSLAFYYGLNSISALVINFNDLIDYSIDWFLSIGFTQKEIDLIQNKTVELKKKCNTPFSCVIWSPAADFSDEIVHDMGYYGKVLSVKRYDYNTLDEYYNIVRAIYAIDDIEKWKIDKKLEHMRAYKPELVAVELQIDEPSFRVKSSTKKPLSRRGERIKKALRTRYQGSVDNYFFDIILHIADNHLQSKYMEKVLEPGIDLREIFAALNKYAYALPKVEALYMPADFPKAVPVGKDVDIICMRNDYDKIIEEMTHISQQEKYKDYSIKIKKLDCGTQFRFEISSKLIFLVDIAWQIPSLNEKYIEDAIAFRSREMGYYRISPKYEYLYRWVAYSIRNTKTHHLDYMNEHYSDRDMSFVDKYCTRKLAAIDALDRS